MKLVRYEFFKLFCKRFIFICIAVFMVINVYKISTIEKRANISGYDTFYDGYDKIYSMVKGEMTEGKILFVINNYNELSQLYENNKMSERPNENRYTLYDYGDYEAVKTIFTAMDYAYNYENNMKKHLDIASDNVDFYLEKGNTYSAKANQKLIDIYSGRNISHYYDTFGFNELFKYDFSSLLIILLILLSLSPSFTMEHDSGMDMLLGTSKNGIMPTARAKITALLLYDIAITVLFTLVDLTAFNIRFGLEGFFSPIYSVQEYFTFTLNLSIFGYIIVSMLLKMLAFFVIGLFVMLCSCIFKNVIFSFGVSTLAVLALILFVDTTRMGFGMVLYMINPLSLITNRNMLGSFETVNIFGSPVLIISVSLFLSLVFAILLIIGISAVYKHRKVSSHIRFKRLFLLRRGNL